MGEFMGGKIATGLLNGLDQLVKENNNILGLPEVRCQKVVLSWY